MGGLTVLRALRAALPRESFLYLGDTARLPYGTKSPRTVQRYAAQAAQVLVTRGVKALVVACNTASGLALDHLKVQFAPLPVFGVVEPGAVAAAGVADGSGVGVLATESTVLGGAYQRALLAQRADLKVFARACPLWVALAEQGNVDDDFAAIVLAHDLRGWCDTGPRTLLLGCTHFPVFTDLLVKALPNHRVVDSALTTAQFVANRVSPTSESGPGQTTFLATDGTARFLRVGRHFLGEAITTVELVDL